MKTIFKIFLRDLRRIHKNVVAIIVVMGISVIPACYAWFNIAACWDPYGNTQDLTVAVANADDGYDSQLINLNLNLGKQIVSSLKENDQIGWKFTSVKKAKNGVKSGKYYAAIVIPKDFSRDLLSVFTGNTDNAKLEYYTNEKENAIAPKITDKGADAVQQQINQTFTQTIAETASGALEVISQNVDGEQGDAFLQKLTEVLEDTSSDLSSMGKTVDSFADMAKAVNTLLSSTQTALPSLDQIGESGKATLSETGDLLESTQASMKTVTDTLDGAVNQSKNFADSLASTANTALDTIDSDGNLAAEHLSDLSQNVDAEVERLSGYLSVLDQIKDDLQNLPIPLDTTVVDQMSASLESAIDKEQAISQKLEEVSSSIQDGIQLSSQTRSDLQALITDSSQDLSDVKDRYRQTIQPQLTELTDSLKSTGSSLGEILDQTQEDTANLGQILGSSNASLSDAQASLEETSSLLANAQEKVHSTLTKIQAARENNPDSPLSELLKTSPSTMGQFLASPVQLETERLYPIDNYGSAMACFYSSLAIWVGGVVMVALLKVDVDEDKSLKNLKPHQKYLGRYLIFLILGLIQSTIICMGDLWFLEIQCIHPFYFLLAGWISSFVYVNIIYSLTVAFGDIGKAICVVLLVIQIAASGGFFPIEVEPAFFLNAYPLLPFTYSINALRECVAGMFQNYYWINLGKLMIFYILALALGLVLRKPLIKIMERFNEKLESTEIM